MFGNTVSLKIDGIIDLGPHWNIQYSVRPIVDDGDAKARNNDKINDQPTPSESGKVKVARTSSPESSSKSSEEETTTELRVTRHGTGSTATSNIKIVKNTGHATNNITSANRVSNSGATAADVSFALGNLIKIKVETSTTTTTTTITTTTKPTTTQKVYTEKYIKGIYQTPRLVKDDIKVQDFIKDIQQNTIAFFRTLKNKVGDVRSKNKVDFITRSYHDKFNQFLNETQSQKILTRLGTQRVILNIIDTSNGIMKRLVNYLIGDMQKKGSLRHGAIGILEGELMNEEKQEYQSACKKFGVCGAKDRFSLFAAEFLTEIVSGDDDKIKSATDCFTELIKEADYSRFGDKKLKKQIVDAMEWIDQIQGNELRPLLISFKNMLVSKNKPLVVMPDAYGSAMNRSVAFLELVDAIDEKLPPTVHTVKEWNECVNAVREWTAGIRHDTMDIMAKFSSQFLVKAAQRIKGKTVKKITQNLKILFKLEKANEERGRTL